MKYSGICNICVCVVPNVQILPMLTFTTIEVKFMSQTLLHTLGMISGYNRRVRAEKENILIQVGFF